MHDDTLFKTAHEALINLADTIVEQREKIEKLEELLGDTRAKLHDARKQIESLNRALLSPRRGMPWR